MELLVKNGNYLMLSPEIENVLDDYKLLKEQFDEAEKSFREKLLKVMIENNIQTQEVGKWRIQQILPKSKEEFDVDKFVSDEDLKFVGLFSSIKEEKEIDYEKLILENPDLVKKYTSVKQTIVVDEKKLKKEFGEIYLKYVNILPGVGNPTLRISEIKEKK